MSELFDDISRVLGSSIPRRQAIRLIVGGVTGAFFMSGSLMPKRAWATTCPTGCSPAMCCPTGIGSGPGGLGFSLCCPEPSRQCCFAGGQQFCCPGTTDPPNATFCCPKGIGNGPRGLGFSALCCTSCEECCFECTGLPPGSCVEFCCPRPMDAPDATKCCPKGAGSGPRGLGFNGLCCKNVEQCCFVCDQGDPVSCVEFCCPRVGDPQNATKCVNGGCVVPTVPIIGATCSGGNPGDCTPKPTVERTDIRTGPPVEIDITVRDTSSGLRSITIVETSNVALVTPLFVEGTTDPVVVTATKIDQTRLSRVVIRACAVNDCCQSADPVITLLEIPEGSGRVKQTFADVPKEENYVMVRNGIHGLKRLFIEVNGERLEPLRLKDDDEVTFQIPSLMMLESNTITLMGFGKAGSSALVVMADSAPRDTLSDPPIIDVPIDEGGIPRKERPAVRSQLRSHIFPRDREMRAGVNMVWGNQVEP